jgi:hypothetical protein
MRFTKLLVVFLFVFLQVLIPVPIAKAAPSSTIVISHIIAGETNATNSEFVGLYNNSSVDINVTGYCLKNKTPAQIACIQAEPNTKVFIRAHNYLTIASTTFAASHNYVPDTTFTSSNLITVGGDTVTLFDAASNEVDHVTWGPSSLSLVTNGTLQRKANPTGAGTLIDSDVTTSDFTALTTAVFPPNASYDEVTVVDVCPNIADVQQTMPTGYLANENGDCQPDSCLNIAGLQVSVPDHYDSDAAGNCTEHDECDNLAGTQQAIPNNMIRSGGNTCVWDLAPLELTELLPNAAGSDTGNEFVEIYNPTNRTVDLSIYSIRVGSNGEKSYAFPIGSTIAPGEYRAFSDSVMKFTLVNTTSRVLLTAIDGTTLGDSGVYDSPVDGESWALFGDSWQYTNQPTPGSSNHAYVYDEPAVADTTDTGLAPCPTGKYRNPLTNRCRTVATDAAVLSACDADQYRNPDTGRCRKISVTGDVTLCKDGQYRSEETNRCRNIVAASTAKPCKDNQYRSEETGRCRSVAASGVPDAAFAVQPVKDTGMAFVGWWALGGVGLFAVGYAGWEWRRELVQIWYRVVGRFSPK